LGKLQNPRDETYGYKMSDQGVVLRKGEEIGTFRMGSTIALLFECPQDYKFMLQPGQKLRLGEQIAGL